MRTVIKMRLTRGEVRWVRRRALGQSQETVARRHHISVERLAALEADPVRETFRGLIPMLWAARVLRRRSGRSLADLAARLGVSRVTYLRRERERPDVLVAWLSAMT